jgi:hypothetical protein
VGLVITQDHWPLSVCGKVIPLVWFALHDRWPDKPEYSSAHVDGVEVETLRLPSTLPWHERIDVAEEFLNSFNPTWISLQFVPYGFHAKGIVRGLGCHLNRLTQNRQTHIMFHELWIGYYKGAPVIERVTGNVQKYFVTTTNQPVELLWCIPAMERMLSASRRLELKFQSFQCSEQSP